jgi:hypothetical protein
MVDSRSLVQMYPYAFAIKRMSLFIVSVLLYLYGVLVNGTPHIGSYHTRVQTCTTSSSRSNRALEIVISAYGWSCCTSM